MSEVSDGDGLMANWTSPDHSLELRRWRTSDAPVLVAAYADRSVPPSFEPRDVPLDEPDAQDFIKRTRTDWEAGGKFSFAVVRSADGALLGGCSVARLSLPDGQAGQLGYWLATPHRGHGHMPRVLAVLLPFAWQALGLVRLRLIMRPGNLNSAAVAVRAGFARGPDQDEFVAGSMRTVATYWLAAPGAGPAP